jgi:amino acid permease
MVATILFSIFALLIQWGAVGVETVVFLIIFHSDIALYHSLFPKGVLIIFTTMIITFVNFQRSEIVGLTASKTENSEINVSSA